MPALKAPGIQFPTPLLPLMVATPVTWPICTSVFLHRPTACPGQPPRDSPSTQTNSDPGHVLLAGRREWELQSSNTILVLAHQIFYWFVFVYPWFELQICWPGCLSTGSQNPATANCGVVGMRVLLWEASASAKMVILEHAVAFVSERENPSLPSPLFVITEQVVFS